MSQIRPFSSGELSGLQGTQESAMQDECVIQDYSSGSNDDYNLPVDSWADGDTLACGYRSISGAEAMADTEVQMLDGLMRLPLSAEASLQNVDRIKLTKRFGVTLAAPIVFDIVGVPERGPSGLVLKLKLVTDGS